MEPLFHLIIPVLMLMAIYPKLDKKYVFLLAPLTFIMDFDRLVPGAHRLYIHSIFFALLLALVIYIVWDKKAFFVSLFYLGSHLLFDMGYPGIAFLYPLVKKTFYITASVIKGSYGKLTAYQKYNETYCKK